jgi:uncharacterized protein (TIGR03118 family)
MLQLSHVSRLGLLLLLTAAFVIAAGSPALAQYSITNLVTTAQDPNLVNAWGISFTPSSPFWVANEGTGTSTLYNAAGSVIPAVFTVPAATAGAKGTPTGTVANSTPGFVVTQNGVSGASVFLFATLDGTISGWSPSVNATTAVIAVNNHGTAAYTGLAIVTVGANTFLYAANAAQNRVEIYDSNFHMTKTFTDATLTGLKVYNVQAIKGKLYVTFDGTAGGAVDVFGPAGKLLQQVSKNGATGPLQAPWGVALAPANFGRLSNLLLVGNVSNGRINAFNVTTGKFVAALKDTTSKIFAVPGLWAITFGGGSAANNGNTNQLFFAAGTDGYATGLFGVINP